MRQATKQLSVYEGRLCSPPDHMSKGIFCDLRCCQSQTPEYCLQVAWWMHLADERGLAVGQSYRGSITGQVVGPIDEPVEIRISSGGRYMASYRLSLTGEYQVQCFVCMICQFATEHASADCKYREPTAGSQDLADMNLHPKHFRDWHSSCVRYSSGLAASMSNQ